MNITVINQHLTEELRPLARITASKPTLPVLAHILLRTVDSAIELTSTDLELALRANCAATIHAPGECTLPAKRLLEMLDQISDGPLDIDVDEKHTATITANKFKSRLQTLKPADFPSLPAVEGEVAVISSVALKLLVERTKYAISEKPQKWVVDGALLTLAGGVAAMVATDGQRLSVATANREAGSEMRVLVPSKTLEALTSLEGGDVEISQGERHLFFVCGSRTIVSRMIDGQFPKYDKIIPKDPERIIVAERGALAACLRRVSVVAEDHVHFDFESGLIRLRAAAAGVGDAAEEVAASYDGEASTVCVTAKHVLEFLERGSDRTVKIALKAGSGAVLLTDGPDFLNVVLAKKS